MKFCLCSIAWWVYHGMSREVHPCMGYHSTRILTTVLTCIENPFSRVSTEVFGRNEWKSSWQSNPYSDSRSRYINTCVTHVTYEHITINRVKVCSATQKITEFDSLRPALAHFHLLTKNQPSLFDCEYWLSRKAKYSSMQNKEKIYLDEYLRSNKVHLLMVDTSEDI